MSTQNDRLDSKSDKGNPTLFVVILGIIILMFALFLILRPRASAAGAPQKTAPSSAQH